MALASNLDSRRVRLLKSATSMLMLAWLATLPASALAQQPLPPPHLLSLFPVGGQAGTTFEITITPGARLDAPEAIVFSQAGITGKPKMTEPDRFYPEPRPVENTFVVTVAANVPPGLYEARVRGEFGLSNARRFAVGKLPETLESEENNTLETANEVEVGTVVNGMMEAAGYDHFKFRAERGQRLVLECLAERLDSRGNLVLTLLDGQGHQLAHSQAAEGSDPVIAWTAPADGDYFVRVHELTFGNNPSTGNSPYRLTLSSGPWIDFVDPPVIARGAAADVTLYGRNLGGQPAGVRLDGHPLEKLTVKVQAPQEPSAGLQDYLRLDPAAAGLDWMVYRHQTAAGPSNPVVLALADYPVVAEREGNDTPEKAQPLELPCEVVGRFDRPGDQDWYSFQAKKDERLWIEIHSQRLGVASDPIFVVQQLIVEESGETTVRELTVQDDQAAPAPNLPIALDTADPAWLFTAPEDGTYRVLVRDQFGSAQGGAGLVYRLRIAPPRPDFRLLAIPGSMLPFNARIDGPPATCVVPPGGAGEILVVALRREGFDAPIEVKLKQAVPGIKAAPAIIAAGESATSLVLHAPPDAKPYTGNVQVVGQGEIDGKPQSREAVPLERVWNVNNVTVDARIGEALTVAIDSTLGVPCRAEAAEDKPWRMSRGGKLEIPLKLVKQDDKFQGKVTFTLVGLPQQSIRAGNVELDLSKPGKALVDVLPAAPVGKRTAFLRGTMELDYRQHPAGAERAEEDKKRIDALAAELAAALQKAGEEKRKAEQLAQQAAQARQAAEAARNQAQQRAQQAEQVAAQADDRQANAKQAAGEAAQAAAEAQAKVQQAGDEEAKKAAQPAADQAQQRAKEAETALAAATAEAEKQRAQLKEAQDALAKAGAALEEAAKKLEEMEQARTQATADEQKAKEESDEARNVAQQAAQQLQRANQVAQPRKVQVPVHSQPITIEIAAYPVEITLAKSELSVQAGEEVELTLRAKRDFGFDGEVTIQLQPPGGVDVRLSGPNKIEQGKNEAVLKLATSRNTTPGKHSLELIMRMNMPNGALEQREKFDLDVAPPPAEEAKQ